MARRVVTLGWRPSDTVALIGKQIRITHEGEGDSIRLWPGHDRPEQARFKVVYQGECTGYSYHVGGGHYISIAGYGHIDVTQPKTTVELITPWWLERLFIYLGLAAPPYQF